MAKEREWDVLTSTRMTAPRIFRLEQWGEMTEEGPRQFIIDAIKAKVESGEMEDSTGQSLISSIRGK